MAADNILALFLLPFFGCLSSKSHSKLGKRDALYPLRHWLRHHPHDEYLPLLDNSYAAQPSGFKTASFVIVLGLLLVAMGTYRAPAVALMPDVTPKPLRSRANAIIKSDGRGRRHSASRRCGGARSQLQDRRFGSCELSAAVYRCVGHHVRRRRRALPHDQGAEAHGGKSGACKAAPGMEPRAGRRRQRPRDAPEARREKSLGFLLASDHALVHRL